MFDYDSNKSTTFEFEIEMIFSKTMQLFQWNPFLWDNIKQKIRIAVVSEDQLLSNLFCFKGKALSCFILNFQPDPRYIFYEVTLNYFPKN